jgi:hypothetical protein
MMNPKNKPLLLIPLALAAVWLSAFTLLASPSLAQPTSTHAIKNGVNVGGGGEEVLMITPTPTASPTATFTPTPVFSATLSVVPSQTEVLVGEMVDVVVSLELNPACQYPVLELTLNQVSGDGGTLAYTVPTTSTVGAPVTNPFTYTLTALTTGTVSFAGQAYGELNCGDGWVWTYVNGNSQQIEIVEPVTPTPTPTYTPTPTTTPVFSATLSVVPSQTEVLVGETVDVVVHVEVNEECEYPVFEWRLTQASEDGGALAYTMPITETVGPPVTNPFTYTLTALTTGTVSLDARAYGERYCGDFWNWVYVNGSSAADIHIVEETVLPTDQLYLPLVRWDE